MRLAQVGVRLGVVGPQPQRGPARRFRLDHLAARLRRNSANLLVLAGAHLAREPREPVPLSTVVSIDTATAPNALTHYNQLNSATFQAVPMPGVTVGKAVEFLEAQAEFSWLKCVSALGSVPVSIDTTVESGICWPLVEGT